METITTKYGKLNGIVSSQLYDNGQVKECRLNQYNTITTQFGTLIPHYTEDEVRRKYIKALSFFQDGNVKSISLEEQIIVNTSIGLIKAEYMSFYEEGALKRIFPLNGKLTGYWTEENEYELADENNFNFSFGSFNTKIIGILFYPSGEVKSLTFWPRELVMVETSIGTIAVRIGISLYENGALKSCEPSMPIRVVTPIGNILAYDINAVGINGDDNSLKFNEDGSVKSLVCSTDEIEAISKKAGEKIIVRPNLTPNMFDYDAMDVIPFTIYFYEDKITIQDNKKEYDFQLEEWEFTIKNNVQKPISKCSDCSSCTMVCG
ncbi:hypothetical protein EDC18_10159 [Natranaerovirga pectinivora]|uniref:MORN repeat protein n=1 Tax=Natranaerovirga pectinivora TaxID=682400 RepID=A0A4R3MPQ6_9FIRM|nr:hypothetical protein [Natranaerovirga pectinivora]TCT16764.1 hypothetical protein EDC18_10159 [Natranaerovirga pectinivora]